MSFVSRVLPFKTVRAEAYGGGRVKIEVKRELLNPAGKDIIATLKFNGTTVHIPKNSEISIGSSSKCDVRINDPTIEFMHLLISAGSKNVSAHNLSFERKTGLFDRKNNEARVLSQEDGDLTLEADRDIMFPLNGVNRYLNMVISIKEESAEAIKAAIALQLAAPRPKIEAISPASLVKRDEQVALAAIDPKLIEDTIFSKAKTPEDINVIYRNKSNKMSGRENSIKNIFMYSSIFFFPVGLILDLFTSSTTLFMYTGAMLTVGFYLALLANKMYFSLKRHFKLNDGLVDVLRKLNAEDITTALGNIKKTDLKDIMEVLAYYDKEKALAVKQLIDQRSKEQVSKETLPSVEIRASLPPAKESLSDVLAKAGLKAAQTRQAIEAGR